MDYIFDVAVIGGGINGCGAAADAALRGLSVVLCEQDDLASQTSSKSTKLIHGGLRYLELLDFSLVKKSLDERQKLLQLAPHLISPLSFILPHQKKMRPFWMLRTGLFLYDHLSRKNTLPRSKLIRRHAHPDYFSPLTNAFTKALSFYDCMTDDARLTLANAIQASEHGASILPHTKLIKAEIIDDQWRLTFKPKKSRSFQIKAKAVINAAGPWVPDVNQILAVPLAHSLSLVKGSHIVVNKLYDGDHAYMLENTDKRMIFAIPYHGFTLIGTTDVVLKDPVDTNTTIDKKETDYLLRLIKHCFKKPCKEKDIITSWSGVRPLIAEKGKASNSLSRDYAINYTSSPAPAITIYGGKITTYRQLSSQTIDALIPVFPHLKNGQSGHTPLPGSTWKTLGFKEYQQHAEKKYHWLGKPTLERYLSHYGTRTEHVLAGCKKIDDLGLCFTETLYQIEVDYLQQEEWARNIDDILWRRTKLGLTIDEAGKKKLQAYLLSCQNGHKAPI